MAGVPFARRVLKYVTPLTRTSTTKTAKRFLTFALPQTPTPTPTPTPWLWVSTHMGSFDNFYNMLDKRFVKVDRSKAYGIDLCTLCIGSSRGSLAYICNEGQQMYLGFPQTGESRKYHRYKKFYDEYDPPDFDSKSYSDLQSSTRFYTKVGDFNTFLCYPRYHTKNPTPHSYHDFYVQWDDDYPSDWVWTRYPNLFHKDDPPIAYCEKTKTVYKLSCYGNEHGPWVVELWDIPGDRINVTSRINVALDSSYEIEAFDRELRARCHQDRYLVLTGDEDGRGDPVLYLVVRYHNRELGISQTRAVDVFRFDLVGQKMIYTTELDNHAFFIGQGSDSFSLPIGQSSPSGLKPDSVYIADDLRVFDLKDGSITTILDTGDLLMTRFQSLWISPPTPEQIEDGKRWHEKRLDHYGRNNGY